MTRSRWRYRCADMAKLRSSDPTDIESTTMDLKSRKASLLRTLAVAVCIACSAAAYAMPKAAENEDAQVTWGANVARPKRSATPAKQPVAGKTRSGTKAKTVKSHKHPKHPGKSKANPGR